MSRKTSEPLWTTRLADYLLDHSFYFGFYCFMVFNFATFQEVRFLIQVAGLLLFVLYILVSARLQAVHRRLNAFEDVSSRLAAERRENVLLLECLQSVASLVTLTRRFMDGIGNPLLEPGGPAAVLVQRSEDAGTFSCRALCEAHLDRLTDIDACLDCRESVAVTINVSTSNGKLAAHLDS